MNRIVALLIGCMALVVAFLACDQNKQAQTSKAQSGGYIPR